jgi:Zn-dependent protease with chaperone function
MILDKHLDYIQEQNVSEIDPLTGGVAIGTGMVLINFASFLFSASTIKASVKVSRPLTKRLNSILKTRDWKVHLVPDKDPNAFAIGGKHVFITTGARKFFTPKEIDAIMLHEAFHSKDYHIYKKMAYDYPLFYLIVTASIASGTVVGFPWLGFLSFLILIKISKIPYAITIGRRHERKADDFAVKYGYAKELISALKKLEKDYLRQMAKYDCGTLCQLINKISNSIDEHPSVRKRIENILKKQRQLASALKSKSLKKIRDLVSKVR